MCAVCHVAFYALDLEEMFQPEFVLSSPGWVHLLLRERASGGDWNSSHYLSASVLGFDLLLPGLQEKNSIVTSVAGSKECPDHFQHSFTL